MLDTKNGCLLLWNRLLLSLVLPGLTLVLLTGCGGGSSPGAQISILDASPTDTVAPVDAASPSDASVSPDGSADTGPVIECKNDLDCVLGYGNVGACQQPVCNTDTNYCELNVKEACCDTTADCDAHCQQLAIDSF